MEALCIYLKHFAYPCCYPGIMCRFGRGILQLFMISNLVMNFINENHKYRLENLGQDLLLQTIFMQKGYLRIIVGVLLTEQYALFADHRNCNEYYKMDIRRCIVSSFTLS